MTAGRRLSEAALACALLAAGAFCALAQDRPATPVQVGVAQILLLTENGYTLVRP